MKKYLKILILAIIFLFVFSISSFATSNKSIDFSNINLDSIEPEKIEKVKGILETADNSNTNIDKVIDVYEDLSKVISNEEIADLIEDNSKTLTNAGVNKKVLSASEKILRNVDSDTIIDIAKNDLDLNKVADIVEGPNSTEEIITSLVLETPVQTQLSIGFKVLFSNFYFRIGLLIFIIVAIYSIYITSLIFHKAGKKKYASLIPLYRDIVHLKVCGMSPWLLIFLLIPILGWFVLLAVAIIARFELSKHFGHGFFFGLGLLILPILFRSIIAFSKNEYIEDLYEEN